MTQYPSFIENEVDSEFCERGKLRWDCFGQEGYRSLMDVLSRKSDTPFKSPEEIFLYYTDLYILINYITNGKYNSHRTQRCEHEDLLTEAIIANKNNSEINWSAIYAYLDERKKQPYLKTGQEVVNRVFKQFKDELRNRDTFCLY